MNNGANQQLNLFKQNSCTLTCDKFNVFKLYTDGASRCNPGPSGIGFSLEKCDQIICQQGFFIGIKTNNQAEYMALIVGIFFAKEFIKQNDVINIFCDSQLLIRQMNNQYKVRDIKLQKLKKVVLDILNGYKYSFCHIYRDKNCKADELANRGIDKKIPLPKKFIDFFFTIYIKGQTLKWVLGCVFTFVLCFTSNIESFEVKVLLQKSLKNEIKNNPIIIKSNNGFIIGKNSKLSVGTKYQQNNISISFDNNSLYVNGKPKQMPCYINPLLSEKHKEILYQTITNWFTTNKDYLNDKSIDLSNFFDNFINKKESLDIKSYQCLTLYLNEIFLTFMNSLIDELDKDSLVISLQTVKQYINSFLSQDIKTIFLNKLTTSNISKHEKKLLNQDELFRHNFLGEITQNLALNLLQEFMLILPRNFLSQILEEDVGAISLNGNNYLGSFAILQENNSIYIINCIDIDDYLLSVIRNEGWPGWPLEMNKVMAITCRTYLVWQVLQAQKLNRIYHIENSVKHQSYKGCHKFNHLKKAVFETKDICISYDNKPILAMFDSCCGGIIPAYINHPDYQKYPYLLRKYKCTFCSDFKISTWEKTFKHNEIVKILNKQFPKLQVIDDIAVTKKDNAGLVTDVSIYSKHNIFHISGKKMYSLFPDIASFAFDIKTYPQKTALKNKSKNIKNKKSDHSHSDSCNNIYNDKQFIISGQGRGHHIGLCQWGAMKLIKDYHWNYQNVLQYYYPGTNLIKLIYER